MGVAWDEHRPKTSKDLMDKKRDPKKAKRPKQKRAPRRKNQATAASNGHATPRKLFNPIVPAAKLHRSFAALLKAPADHPGRAMMEEIYAEFDDPDGNFLEQLQTVAFDARFFELYLFAYLSRSNYVIQPRKENPDFIVSHDGLKVAIEATTVNPSTSGALQKVGKRIGDLNGPELLMYLRHELAIRFGSPLFSKLSKRYWELPHCQGLPFVLAVEPFHDEDALALSDNSLSCFLYGLTQDGKWSKDGKLEIATEALAQHEIEGKSIPSNFFGQPGAENISAVIFSNSGTLAKFDRMGYAHGYGNDSWILSRSGFSFVWDHDAMDPALFAYDVGQPPQVESWGQGLVVCHNPRAMHPLPRHFFVDAVQQYMENGVLVTDHCAWHPFCSKTQIIHFGAAKKKFEEMLLARSAIAVAAITKKEFQAASGINHDGNPIIEEQGWFSDESGSFLAVVIFDRCDKDWRFVILARDAYFAFRVIETGPSFASRQDARMQLQIRVASLLRKPKRIFAQH